jgi:DNA-binding response OmpR family regulator
LDLLKSRTRYDLLIVDNDIPGLSGLELVLRVRSMAHRRNIPIIMLSGNECEKEAWRAGVDDFLRKTDAVNELVSRITRVLEKRREKSRTK